jgi:hypothetical protein
MKGRIKQIRMIFYLAVRLARNSKSALGEFCIADETDQFWFDPTEDPDSGNYEQAREAAEAVDGFDNDDVKWFRYRRIAYLLRAD